MSPWVWGCHVALQPWTQSHLFLQYPWRRRQEKTIMSVHPWPQINKQFISVLALSLRKEERVFPYLTISLWSTNAPVVIHMSKRHTHSWLPWDWGWQQHVSTVSLILLQSEGILVGLKERWKILKNTFSSYKGFFINFRAFILGYLVLYLPDMMFLSLF